MGGLAGGGRSPAKPVCAGQIPWDQGKMQGIYQFERNSEVFGARCPPDFLLFSSKFPKQWSRELISGCREMFSTLQGFSNDNPAATRRACSPLEPFDRISIARRTKPVRH